MADVRVNVGVNNTAFNRGLDAMRSKASSWAGSMAKSIAGVFAVGALSNFFNTFREELDRVAKLATRLGETTDTIQRIGEAAGLAGADIEMIAKSMSKLTIEAGNASEKFAAAGISAQAFANASLEEKVLMLSSAYQQASTNQSQMIALMDLLGGRAQDLLPFLSEGPEALAAGFESASLVSENAIRNIEKMNDTLEKMGKIVYSLAGEAFDFLDQVLTGITLKFGAESSKPGIINRMAKDMGMEDPKDWGKPKAKPAEVVSPEDAKKVEDEKKKVASEADKLEEALLRRKLEQMTLEERILELQKMEYELQLKVRDATLPELERLEAANKLLGVQKEIADAQNEQGENNKRIADAQASLDERKLKRELDALPIAEKIARLEALKNKAQTEGEDPALTEEQRIANANKVLDIEDEIASAKEQQKDEEQQAKDEADKLAKEGKDKNKLGIVASALGEVGGGGGSYVSGDPATRELQTQTNLLKRLVANTSPQQQRSANIKPEDAF